MNKRQQLTYMKAVNFTRIASTLELINEVNKKERKRPLTRINRYLSERNKKGRFTTDFDDMLKNSRIFEENFHMSVESFSYLLEVLEPHLKVGQSSWKDLTLSPKHKLAVVLELGKRHDYYERILKTINGILLPGGLASSLKDKDYLHAGKIIYELAVEMNNNGDYFPIWGTCLGFELLLLITAKDDQDPRRIFPRINQSLRLKFTNGFKLSKMFKDVKQNVVDILSKQRVTYNNHCYCITQEDIYKFGLDNDWRETSVSSDSRGINFISTIEHRRYPFYGVQFHPEKNAYDYTFPHINHSPSAIKSSRFFANFFVDECRKNKHCFFSKIDETRHLIYNFPITFARMRGRNYAELYLFKKYVDYPLKLSDDEDELELIED